MRFPSSFLLFVAIVAVGCSGRAGATGAVAVTGVVTYQGQAVDGAIVVFSPEGAGQAASGRTDGGGRFQLTTLKAGDGAVPGKYKVSIVKTEGGGAEMTPEEAQKQFKNGRPPVIPRKDVLPAKYKPGASELAAEVAAGGKNDFSFDLTD